MGEGKITDKTKGSMDRVLNDITSELGRAKKGQQDETVSLSSDIQMEAQSNEECTGPIEGGSNWRDLNSNWNGFSNGGPPDCVFIDGNTSALSGDSPELGANKNESSQMEVEAGMGGRKSADEDIGISAMSS